jgi:hypothetical protein
MAQQIWLEVIRQNLFGYHCNDLANNNIPWVGCRYLSTCDWAKLKIMFIGSWDIMKIGMKLEMREDFILLNQIGWLAKWECVSSLILRKQQYRGS